MRQFTNEPDKFDDLFESIFDYANVEKQAETQLSPEELLWFNLYSNKRIAHLPMDLLKLHQHNTEHDRVSTSMS